MMSPTSGEFEGPNDGNDSRVETRSCSVLIPSIRG